MGSIPTRSRAIRAAGTLLASAAIMASHAVSPRLLSAQETDPRARAGEIGADSLAADSLAADSLRAELDAAAPVPPVAGQAARSDSTGPLPPVSPMGAFFRSLVLPGWGQVSVDQPGRGAFYFAVEAGSLWMLLKTNAKLNAARRSYPPDQDLIDSREAQFEDWAALAVFWALFAGVDAWVSAQLWDFTGEVVPPPDGSPGAAFQYSVPVGP